MRPVTIAISSLLILFLSACVAPGSSMGRVVVSGQLFDPSGQAVADEEVQIVLPATYGLGGLDSVLNGPSDFGRDDQLFELVTNTEGRFEQDLGVQVYHMSFWILPPLGGFPRRPPAPFVLLRFPERGEEIYAVQTWNGDYQIVDTLGESLDIDSAPIVIGGTKDVKWDGEEIRGTRSEINLRIRD